MNENRHLFFQIKIQIIHFVMDEINTVLLYTFYNFSYRMCFSLLQILLLEILRFDFFMYILKHFA